MADTIKPGKIIQTLIQLTLTTLYVKGKQILLMNFLNCKENYGEKRFFTEKRHFLLPFCGIFLFTHILSSKPDFTRGYFFLVFPFSCPPNGLLFRMILLPVCKVVSYEGTLEIS